VTTTDGIPAAVSQGQRIRGIDIARGLAVLGMFAAHIASPPEFDIVDPSTWGGIVDGRSSILFAVLAGVSIAILSGRTKPVDGVALVQARLRIMTRGVLIFALGGVLTLFSVGIAVILEYYAVLFVLAIPFLRWRSRNLFVLAGVLAVTIPFAQTGLAQFLRAADAESMITTLLVDGWYPVLVWIVFVLVGLGVGRLDLRSPQIVLYLLGTGIVLAAVGYTLGSLAARMWGIPEDEVRLGGFRWEALFTVAPHSGSPFEVIGSTGFALAVIAICLLVSRPLRVVLFPVAATGQLALTAYSAHIVALFLLEVPSRGSALPLDEPDYVAVFLWFAGVTLACCTVWVLVVGRGPLESLISSISRRTAAVTLRGPAGAEDNPR